MGIGSKFKKAVSKAGGGTRILSYVAPYTALATTKGRAELMKTYRPLIQGAAGMVGGGSAASAGLSALDAYGAASSQGDFTTQADTMNRYMNAGYDPASGVEPKPWDAPRMKPWLIGGGAVLLLLILARFLGFRRA